MSVVEVAAQAWHSATVALDTYGHIIEELAGANISAEDAIRTARQGVGFALLPSTSVV